MKEETKQEVIMALKVSALALLGAILLIIIFKLIMGTPVRGASPAAANSDAIYLDSCFRWLEKKPSGGTTRLKQKVFMPNVKVLLPQVTGTVSRRKFIIDMQGSVIKGNGFFDGSPDWRKMHETNTFRSITIINGEFNNCDIGLVVQGAQMNDFTCLTFAGCRVGARFELCLQTNIGNIELNQCIDTGMYIGISWQPGCTNYNSQSNNTRVNLVRCFGRGTETAVIFKGVSGCSISNCTIEGGGATIFLMVDGKNSNFVKSFYADGFHIEGECKRAVVYARVDGYGTFTFSNIYPLIGNVIVEAEGTGTIRINDLHYHPAGNWKYGHNYFKSNSPESGPLWWEFNNCQRAGGRPFSDNYYWITTDGGNKPKPFVPDQVNNNYGSNRLKENIHIKE